MIREATNGDILDVLAMGRKFADEAGVTARTGWDDGEVCRLLEMMAGDNDHILLIAPNGIFGALVFPHPFSGRKICQEMFWRAEGGDGLRLLKRAEELAAERGAKLMLMLDLPEMPGAARIYERRGYALAERTFIKEL